MRIRWPNPPDSAALGAAEAHVWAVPLVVTPIVWDTLWSTLSPDERDRAGDFRLEDPRRRFVIARGALRGLLGRYLSESPSSLEFTQDGNEKPRLADEYRESNLQFNVSHSGDLALIVFATGCDVGIDVEQLREVGRMEQIARRFFHSTEVDELLSAAPAARNVAFLRCWTAKEAVLKAYGTGITGSLDSFQVPTGESAGVWLDLSAVPRLENRARCWLQQLDPCAGYVAAMASVESQHTVRCFTFEM